jgi:decaprenylphospho-beta-D-ribofuranose 2-oxidase
MTKFFHPLDGVGQWPRLYGPGGLVQWQIAVPREARSLITASLRRLAWSGAVPSLVVLKRFGASTPAPLSFPFPGWTLAVDVPAGHPRLRPLLSELDQEVAEAGGRIYLAKDARASAATIARMYPRLPEWRAVRARLDPEGRIQSDLARRLELT